MLEVLRAAGANLSARDKTRRTPLNWARDLEEEETVTWLKGQGAEEGTELLPVIPVTYPPKASESPYPRASPPPITRNTHSNTMNEEVVYQEGEEDGVTDEAPQKRRSSEQSPPRGSISPDTCVSLPPPLPPSLTQGGRVSSSLSSLRHTGFGNPDLPLSSFASPAPSLTATMAQNAHHSGFMFSGSSPNPSFNFASNGQSQTASLAALFRDEQPSLQPSQFSSLRTTVTTPTAATDSVKHLLEEEPEQGEDEAGPPRKKEKKEASAFAD